MAWKHLHGRTTELHSAQSLRREPVDITRYSCTTRQRDTTRYNEIRRDTTRYNEIRRDMTRYDEIQRKEMCDGMEALAWKDDGAALCTVTP
jgi:hypothetical protein